MHEPEQVLIYLPNGTVDTYLLDFNLDDNWEYSGGVLWFQALRKDTATKEYYSFERRTNLPFLILKYGDTKRG
jgi:hypothetical protein